MRKHSQSFIIYLIFGAIIVVFAVNFGPGSASCGRAQGVNWAAAVNGDLIRQDEYGRALHQRLEYERRFRGRVDDAARQRLRQQVLSDLMQQRLLGQEAVRRGLRATDEELLEYLKARYSVENLSAEDYRNWVSRGFRTTVARFEDRAREEILTAKLQRLIRDTVTVSDAELKADYVREKDRAKATYVRFDSHGIDVPAPTKEAALELLANESEAVMAHYQKQSYKYVVPKEVRIRQIVRKLPDKATDADVAKVRAFLLDLKQQLEGGADFTALANEHSEDAATKEAGGDLGFKKLSDLDSAISRAVFSLKAGDFSSEPVRTAQGLHLVQVQEVKEQTTRPFDDVKNEVAFDLGRDRAGLAEAEKRASELMATLRGGKKLEDLTMTDLEVREAKKNDPAAKPPKPVRRDTPWFQKNAEAVPGIGIAKDLQEELLGLTLEAPLCSKPYKVGRAFYVVQLKERETPDLTKFEETKDSLREQAQMQKSFQVMREWAEHLQSEARIELNAELFGRDTGEG